MNEKIKIWIANNILDKNGNPQGRSFSVRKKKNAEECNIILEVTAFLDKNCSLSERV